MAAQRAPQDDRDSRPPRTLRLIHSVDTPASAPSSPSAFRGVLWAIVLSVVGFWVPVAAIVTYLLVR